MNKDRLLKLFSKAESDLSKARGELYKPEEDVVNYSACISARSALYHFLGCLYVLDLETGEEEEDNSLEKGKKTIDDLALRAGRRHPGLRQIDFSPMRCSCKEVKDVINNDEIYFCNNTEVVKYCTGLAEQLRELVIDDAFGGEEPKLKSL